MTLLDREIVDAVSIAAATAAMLVAGRREERSSFVRRQPGSRSRLTTAVALGLVAALATVGVVWVFGPHRARANNDPRVPNLVPHQEMSSPAKRSAGYTIRFRSAARSGSLRETGTGAGRRPSPSRRQRL